MLVFQSLKKNDLTACGSTPVPSRSAVVCLHLSPGLTKKAYHIIFIYEKMLVIHFVQFHGNINVK